MEPVSIMSLTGTSIAVAKVVYESLGKVCVFYKESADASNTFDSLRESVKNAEVMLQFIEGNVRRGMAVAYSSLHERLQECFEGCHQSLLCIQETASKHETAMRGVGKFDAFVGNLKFTFQKSEIDRQRDDLNTRIQDIIRMYEMSQISPSLEAGERMSRSEDGLCHASSHLLKTIDGPEPDAHTMAASTNWASVNGGSTLPRGGRLARKIWSRTLIEAAGVNDVETMNECLHKGAGVDYQSTDRPPKYQGMAPVHAAAQHGHLAAMDVLVRRRANLYAVVEATKQTALHLAARCGHLELTQYLIRNRANLNAHDMHGQTPLLSACKEDIKVALLEAGAEARHLGLEDYSALHYAAVCGHGQAVRLIVRQHGVQVDARNSMKHTPLWLACASSFENEALLAGIVRELLIYGASPNARDIDGSTPFCAAVRSGRALLVKALLESPRKKVDWTVGSQPHLHIAAMLPDADVLEHISRHCGDLNRLAQIPAGLGGFESSAATTALNAAVAAGSLPCAHFLAANPEVSLLGEQAGDRVYPLHLAFQMDDTSMAEMLLTQHKERGVPITQLSRDAAGPPLWPIHVAKTARHVDLWVDHGGPVSVKKTLVDMPVLHHLSCYASSPVVERLIARGADVGEKDKRDATAIDVLCSRKDVWGAANGPHFTARLAVLQLLREHTPLTPGSRENIEVCAAKNRQPAKTTLPKHTPLNPGSREKIEMCAKKGKRLAKTTLPKHTPLNPRSREKIEVCARKDRQPAKTTLPKHTPLNPGPREKTEVCARKDRQLANTTEKHLSWRSPLEYLPRTVTGMAMAGAAMATGMVIKQHGLGLLLDHSAALLPVATAFIASKAGVELPAGGAGG